MYDRIDTPNTHGTGCTLSSAIASFLALGYPLEEAVAHAGDYLHKAILCGADRALGGGHGPVDHFYKFMDRA
jgi:hydroxymethylpyrimidine/phosphomethylpyrimidine kinase